MKTKIGITLFVLLIPFVGFSQIKASLSFNNTPVKEAIQQIEKTYGVYFIYDSSIVNDNLKVSADKKNSTLISLLDEIFSNTNIAYSIEENHVALLLKSSTNNPQNTDQVSIVQENNTGGNSNPTQASMPEKGVVRGIILDELGLPLEGATIHVQGKQIYAITDAKGEFRVTGIMPADVLTVCYIGFKQIDMPVGNRTFLKIKMVSDAVLLDEALVTGYVTLSKERATGAFNRVNSDVIEQRRVSDLSTALLGTVAGMQGKENSDGTIDYIIRGTTSLYADASPLVVVDGFPVSNGFRDVNPNDVENITVLKDAAAAAIWGARSANGVIVITTKRAAATGSNQAKKVNVNVSAMAKISKKLNLNTVLTTASSEDHVFYEKLAFDNNWIFSDYSNVFSSLLISPMTLVSEQVYAYKSGRITEAELNVRLAELSQTNNRGQIKDLLLKNPVLQQYNLTITSSNASVKNYISALYEHGKGNMIENHNDRWRIHYNNQVKVFKWLDFNLSTNLHLFKNTTSGPTIDEIGALSPYEMILNPDGSYAEQLMINREQLSKIPAGVLPYDDWSYNILREARARDLTAEQLNTRVQAGLTFKITEGLKLSSSIQYEYNKGEVKNLYTEDSFYTRNFINTWINYNNTTGTLNKQYVPKGAILKTQKSTNQNYVWRNQIDFDRTFANKHVVATVAGFEVQEYKTNSQRDPWVFGYDPDRNSSALVNLNPTESVVNITGTAPYYVFPGINNSTREGLLPVYGYRLDRYVSVYGNASYTFDNKYSITGSVRSDASNLIADNASYRWAPLWSIGVKWNATQEGFMQSTRSWLDRLALRLTYGFNGNVEKSTSHKTLIGMSSAPSTTFAGFYTGTVTFGNPNLRWEKTKSINFGVDYSLFHSKFFGSINVYNKQGKDIIGNVALPSVLGATAQMINNAEISNKGVEIEVGVNTRVIDYVRFTGKLTYAYNKNKITNLYNPSVYTYDILDYGTYVEGCSVGGLWGYEYLGMTDGVPYVAGINGQPNSMDDLNIHNRGLGLQILKFAGDGIAPHTLGLHIGFSGYGFTLSAFANGTFGGHFRNPTFNYTMVGGSKVVIPKFVNEVINGSDKLPSWPLPNATGTYRWDRYVPNLLTMVESSSFIKLKEINLEYNIPPRLSDAIGIGSTKVFAQVRDLGCLWTANSRGYDPEWLPGTLKPATTYALGVNVNF